MAKFRISVRMNISVPPELKKQMDATKEPVNWSAIAAEAFRRNLQELALTREMPNMKDVLERLKKAREEERTEESDEGKEVGISWARNVATEKQLWRLGENNNLVPFGLRMPDAFGWPGVLFVTIQGKTFEGRSSLNDFWENQIGCESKRLFSEDFARGFVAGALAVWKAIQEQL
jgi:hypothetical protein